MIKMRLSNRKFHFALSFLCCCKRNRKMGKGQKPIEIVFLRWLSKNEKNEKMDLQQKSPDTICVWKGEKIAHFRAHYLFAQNSLGPKQWKAGRSIKCVVSAEITQNLKWHLLFWRRCFWHGWKSVFTNCVFEKLCFSENTMFIVFSANTAAAIKKMYVDKKLWKIVGCFRTWQKGVFVFFSGFNVFVVWFLCVW